MEIIVELKLGNSLQVYLGFLSLKKS